MPITVKEMLSLPISDDFRLVAGKNGLNRHVKKVGIIDHETVDSILDGFEVNEFVLSTFITIKDKPHKLINYVKQLVKAGSSGLAIKTIYFKTIPEEVIKYAHLKSYPIFTFNTVFYEDIITSVVDANKEKEYITNIESKINDIMSGELSRDGMRDIAYSINKALRDLHIVVYVQEKNKETSKSLASVIKYNAQYDIYNSILPYQKGAFIIFTFNNEIKNKKDFIINKLKELGISEDNFTIGISSMHHSIENIYESINESFYAFRYALNNSNGSVFYEQMGINRLLLPVLENQFVKNYCNSIIRPLIDSDKKTDSNLLETAISYVMHNGDIKETAKSLYQHSNTIRYRINKIKDILVGKELVTDFYQELSVAIGYYVFTNGDM